MKIIYLFILMCLCIVNAKYLPDQSESKVLLGRQLRSTDDMSDISQDSNSEDSDDDYYHNNKNEDSDDTSSTSTDLDIIVQKQVLKEQELIRKQQEEKEKYERKAAEEIRKQEEKKAKEERKRQENLEKEERKRLERIEKDRIKKEEIEHKRQVKLEKAELRLQQNIIKQLKKLEKESTETDESSESTETDQSLELDDIGKIYIYEKYGISPFSTELEKKMALDQFLREELGLNANSSISEYRRAVVNIIQNKILSDPEILVDFKSYILEYVSPADIENLKVKLGSKMNKLDVETALLNNITLPWVKESQQIIEEKRVFLQALQSLSGLLLKWISEESQPTLSTVVDSSISTATDASSASSTSSVNESTASTINDASTTSVYPSSANISPAGTDGSIDNSNAPSSTSNTENSSSTDISFVSTKSPNTLEGVQNVSGTTIINSVTSTTNEDRQTPESNDASVTGSGLAGTTDTTLVTLHGFTSSALPIINTSTISQLSSNLPSVPQGSISTTVISLSDSSVNINNSQINLTAPSEMNIPENTDKNDATHSGGAALGSENSSNLASTVPIAINNPVSNVTELTVSGTEATINSADSSKVSDVNNGSQATFETANTSDLSNQNSVTTELSLTNTEVDTGLTNTNEQLGSSKDSFGSETETISSIKLTPAVSVITVTNAPEVSLTPTENLTSVTTDDSANTILKSTPGSIDMVSNVSDSPSTEGSTTDIQEPNEAEMATGSNRVPSLTTTTDNSTTIVNTVNELITTNSGIDIVGSSTSIPTLVVSDNMTDAVTGSSSISTEYNSAATTLKPVPEIVATSLSDASTTITNSVSTTKRSSDPSSTDIIITEDLQSTVSNQFATDTTKLDGTSAINNVPSTNNETNTPSAEIASTTEISVSKHIPTEMNTPQTVIVDTERTVPQVVVVPGEPGTKILDVQPQ